MESSKSDGQTRKWRKSGGKVVRRKSTLIDNIHREARQSHRLLAYPRTPATLLALLQIFLGVASIIFMAVHVYDCSQGCKAVFWQIGYGIWSGVLFIFTGSFGLWTSSHSFRGTIAFYSVLCVLTACECSLPFSFAVCDSVYSQFNRPDPKKLWRIMIAVVAAVSALEAIVALCSAILCCRTLCRGSKNKRKQKGTEKHKSRGMTSNHSSEESINNTNFDDNNNTIATATDTNTIDTETETHSIGVGDDMPNITL